MSTGVPNADQGRINALKNREKRSELKAMVDKGDLKISEVLDAGKYGSGDPVVGHLDVGDLVLALDGVGHVKADKILAAAGIDPGAHVMQLSQKHREALLDAVEAEGFTARKQ